MNENETMLLTAIKQWVKETAKKNGWEDFYNYHIKIVVKCAEDILDKDLPQVGGADKFITLAGAWLHDIALVNVKKKHTHPSHHTKGYKIAKKKLTELGIETELAEFIAQCVLRHRNTKEYPAETAEQIIVSAADSMSHFKSIVYLTHHYYNPKDNLTEMVNYLSGKLERDWADITRINGLAELCSVEYRALRIMLASFNQESTASDRYRFP